MDMGDDDGGTLDQVDNPNCHSRRVKKRLKKEKDGGPSHEEIDDENKNPFQIQVILDAVFKLLTFEDVKKFRLVSSAWNEVGFKEISKRSQKHISFYENEDLELDDKLGELIQIQKRHNQVFPGHHTQLFTNFSFYIQLLTSPQIAQFFDHFPAPKLIGLFGNHYMPSESDVSLIGVNDLPFSKFFTNFLAKISSTVQEIQFNDFDANIFDSSQRDQVSCDDVLEISTIKFPNLRKISHNIRDSDLNRLLFYPIIGQNSPKLCHLEFGSFSLRYISENMKEFFQTGILGKIHILDLFELEVSQDLLEIFVDFGQNGLFKLTQLNYKCMEFTTDDEPVQELFFRFIESQVASLKVLKILSFREILHLSRIRNQFPAFHQLKFLQIDKFSRFKSYFQPLDFSIQTPKLEEFTTSDIRNFLFYNLGKGGDSVKSVSLIKDGYDDTTRCRFVNGEYVSKEFYDLNFIKFGQIFPNLEFFELDFSFIRVGFFSDQLNFWSKLRKVVINCELKDLLELNQPFLKVVKNLEILVKCGNNLIEDNYKNQLGDFMKNENDVRVDLDHYDRQKFYQKFLTAFSKNCSVFIHSDSTSMTFEGFKISESFKRELVSIFPHCYFTNAK